MSIYNVPQCLPSAQCCCSEVAETSEVEVLREQRAVLEWNCRSCSFPTLHPSLELNSLLYLKLLIGLETTGSKQKVTASNLPSTEILVCDPNTQLQFQHEFWGLNSEPCTCFAIILSTRSSFQLLHKWVEYQFVVSFLFSVKLLVWK